MKFEYSPAPAGGRVRTRVRVEGIVQGVGFRPFVHGLATRLDLAGFVGNDAQGIFLEIEGDDTVVAEFLRVLEAEPPPLAVIETITGSAGRGPAETPSARPSPPCGRARSWP